MDDWREDFSFDFYEGILRTLDRRLKVVPLSEVYSHDSAAAVRHDIDISIEAAVDMARVEDELGIKSTYMVWPRSPFYDMEEEQGRLNKIESLGHEIGLHYDPENRHPTSLSSELPRIKELRDRLEGIINRNICTISFHMPTDQILRGPQYIDGMVNAYSEILMQEYISDSGGRWREGNPIESINSIPEEEIVQILTHPVWWGEKHKPPSARLSEFINSRGDMDQDRYDCLSSLFPRDLGIETDRDELY